MLCSAESRKQVCSVVMTLCPGATNPDAYGDKGLATGVHHLEEAVGEECFCHVWRRKTTVSAGVQNQQPGEEEFIKRKVKRSKVCLCKGRASRSHPATRSHRGSGLEPCSPSCSHTSHLLSWAVLALWDPPAPLSGPAGLQQKNFTKLDVFIPPSIIICCWVWGTQAAVVPRASGWFFRAQSPTGDTHPCSSWLPGLASPLARRPASSQQNSWNRLQKDLQ